MDRRSLLKAIGSLVPLSLLSGFGYSDLPTSVLPKLTLGTDPTIEEVAITFDGSNHEFGLVHVVRIKGRLEPYLQLKDYKQHMQRYYDYSTKGYGRVIGTNYQYQIFTGKLSTEVRVLERC